MTARPTTASAPYADLAAFLRRLRTAARLTQQQLGAAPGLSRSAVQRAESGTSTTSPEMLRAYVTACRGSAADHAAVQAQRARGRAALRGVLRTLKAPHPAAARGRADFQAILAAAYESAGAPPLRAFAEHVPPGGAPIPLGSASRIAHRQSLPKNARQLETWLAVCRVPKAHLQHYRSAYAALHRDTAARPIRRSPAPDTLRSYVASIDAWTDDPFRSLYAGPVGWRQPTGRAQYSPTDTVILTQEVRREAVLNGRHPDQSPWFASYDVRLHGDGPDFVGELPDGTLFLAEAKSHQRSDGLSARTGSGPADGGGSAAATGGRRPAIEAAHP